MGHTITRGHRVTVTTAVAAAHLACTVGLLACVVARIGRVERRQRGIYRTAEYAIGYADGRRGRDPETRRTLRAVQ